MRHFVFAVAVLSATPAFSCGNPLLWTMLFARVPEAQQVFDADTAARRAGTLHGRVFNPSIPGIDYHRWSMAWLDDAANTMNDSIVSSLAEGESITILLADEVAAMHFQPGVAPTVISAAGLNFADGFDVITTINALESGLNYGLSATRMIDQGVLVSMDTHRDSIIVNLF